MAPTDILDLKLQLTGDKAIDNRLKKLQKSLQLSGTFESNIRKSLEFKKAIKGNAESIQAMVQASRKKLLELSNPVKKAKDEIESLKAGVVGLQAKFERVDESLIRTENGVISLTGAMVNSDGALTQLGEGTVNAVSKVRKRIMDLKAEVDKVRPILETLTSGGPKTSKTLGNMSKAESSLNQTQDLVMGQIMLEVRAAKARMAKKLLTSGVFRGGIPAEFDYTGPIGDSYKMGADNQYVSGQVIRNKQLLQAAALERLARPARLAHPGLPMPSWMKLDSFHFNPYDPMRARGHTVDIRQHLAQQLTPQSILRGRHNQRAAILGLPEPGQTSQLDTLKRQGIDEQLVRNQKTLKELQRDRVMLQERLNSALEDESRILRNELSSEKSKREACAVTREIKNQIKSIDKEISVLAREKAKADKEAARASKLRVQEAKTQVQVEKEKLEIRKEQVKKLIQETKYQSQLNQQRADQLTQVALSSGEKTTTNIHEMKKLLAGVNAQLAKERANFAAIDMTSEDTVETAARQKEIQEKINALLQERSKLERNIGRLKDAQNALALKAQKHFTAFRQTFFTGLIAATTVLYPLRKVVETAGEAEKALNALDRQARLNGIFGDRSRDTVRNLDIVQNGLISVSQAGKAVRNLMRIGFNFDEAVKAARQITEIAVENKQSALTLGQAVVSSTEGFRQELSVLADAGGITKNLSVIYKEFAQEIGISAKQLSKRQKALAIMKEIEHESVIASGALDTVMKTLSGSVDSSTGAITIFQQTLGLKLKPIVVALTTAFKETVKILTDFVSKNQALVTFVGALASVVISLGSVLLATNLVKSAFLGLSTGLAAMLFKVTNLMSTLPMLSSIIGAMTTTVEGAGVAVGTLQLSMGGLLGIIGFVVSAISLLTFKIMKASDDLSQSSKTVGQVKQEFNDLAVVAEKVDKKFESMDESIASGFKGSISPVEELRSSLLSLEAVQNDYFLKTKVTAADSLGKLKELYADVRKEIQLTRRAQMESMLDDAIKVKMEKEQARKNFIPSRGQASMILGEMARNLVKKDPAGFSGLQSDLYKMSGEEQSRVLDELRDIAKGGIFESLNFQEFISSIPGDTMRNALSLPKGAWGTSSAAQRRIKRLKMIESEIKSGIEIYRKMLDVDIAAAKKQEEDIRKKLAGLEPLTGENPTQKDKTVIKTSDTLEKSFAAYKKRIYTQKMLVAKSVTALEDLNKDVEKFKKQAEKKGEAEIYTRAGTRVDAIIEALKTGKKETFSESDVELIKSIAGINPKLAQEIRSTIEESIKVEDRLLKEIEEHKKNNQKRIKRIMARDSSYVSNFRNIKDMMGSVLFDPATGEDVKASDFVKGLKSAADIQKEVSTLNAEIRQLSDEISKLGPDQEELRKGLEDDLRQKTEAAEVLRANQRVSAKYNDLLRQYIITQSREYKARLKEFSNTEEGRKQREEETQKRIKNLELIKKIAGLDKEGMALLEERTVESIDTLSLLLQNRGKLSELEEMKLQQQAKLLELGDLSGRASAMTLEQKKEHIVKLKELKKTLEDYGKELDKVTNAEDDDLARAKNANQRALNSINSRIEMWQARVNGQENENQLIDPFIRKVNLAISGYGTAKSKYEELLRLRKELSLLEEQADDPMSRKKLSTQGERIAVALPKMARQQFSGTGTGITAKMQELEDFKKWYRRHSDEITTIDEERNIIVRQLDAETNELRQQYARDTNRLLKDGFTEVYLSIYDKSKTTADALFDVFKSLVDRMNRMIFERAMENTVMDAVFSGISGQFNKAAGVGNLGSNYPIPNVDLGKTTSAGLINSATGSVAPSLGRVPLQAPVNINIKAMDGESVMRVLTSPDGERGIHAAVASINRKYGDKE